jgi:hypothetical protein
MTDGEATLQDIWRLLGSMNKRFGERFDVLERQIVELDARLSGRIGSLDARLSALDASVTSRLSALKESIEARDFRLDDHGRRLSTLEAAVDKQ